MRNSIKRFFKENSLYLIILTLAEFILSTVCTISFVYSDSLTYSESIIYQSLGVETLLQSIYSSTFWALILVLLAIIVMFSITCLVFRKIEYQFISLLGWIELFILSLNFTKPIGEILSTCALFIPIIIINIICYKKEYDKLQLLNKKTKKQA
ncbi:MAG: hypothetical protein IKP76_01345 [Bacilli bacterium]|nr:hypothetical protein [Bacilli bacterium]